MTAGQASRGLTDQHRWYLDAYGYLAVRGLLTADIGEISAAFDAVFDDPANPRLKWEPPGHRGHPQWMMGDFVEKHPLLAELPRDPRLVGLAHDLLGADAVYVGDDGSIYRCETEWHCDTPAVHADCRHLKFAIYLDPVGQAVGAPRLLPGSHHLDVAGAGPLKRYLGYDGAIEERTGMRGEDLPHWGLGCAPGDVLLWDFRVMHASYGTLAPRRQIALNFRAASPEGPAAGGTS